MKARPTKPAKSVVHRSPQEQLERIDTEIGATTAALNRAKRMAPLALLGGLVLTAVIMGVTWALTGWIVFWALPVVLIGGGISAMGYKTVAASGQKLAVLNRERRAVEKLLPNQPYGHARPEA